MSYTNNFWDWGRSGMSDTSKTYAGFFDACASSGPAGCALATNATKDFAGVSKGIQRRVEEMIERLRERPVAVAKSKVGPGSVGASDVKYAVSPPSFINTITYKSCRYSTVSTLPSSGASPPYLLQRPSNESDRPALATALAALEKGDGTLLYEMNNHNDEMERKDPLDNVFHRSMESSMASTAVRPFSRSRLLLELISYRRRSCAPTLTRVLSTFAL